MQKSPFKSLLIAAALGLATGRAATVTKSATGTDLTAGASWTGSVAPGAADVATWTTSSLGPGLTAATNVTWGSVNITGATGAIAIAGAGTITTGNVSLTGPQTLSLANTVALSGNAVYTIADVTASTAADATFSGIVSGSGFGITKAGAGTLVLSNVANSFSGNVVINSGELQANAGTAASGAVTTLGTGSITANSGTTLRLKAGSTANVYTYANAIALNNATLAFEDGNQVVAGAVTLTGANTVTGVWGGKNLTLTGAVGGTGSLIKSGTAGQGTTFVLAGANTYSGGTTVADGTLSLDFSNAAAPASDILLNGSSLSLGAGTTFSVTGKASAANTQTLGGVTLASGNATITANAGVSGTMTVNLGALTRNGSATVNFTGTGVVTTTSGIASTLLTDAVTGGAYATVGGSDWAAKDASNNSIVGLSTIGGYTAFADASAPVSLSGNADLTQATAGTYTLSGGASVASIRNTTIAGNTIALAGFNLSTAGILSNVGLTISGSGNLLAATQGGELVLAQTAGTMVIASVITNNGTASSLTKTGSGTVSLSGTQSYTGATNVVQGTLQLGSSPTLGGATATLATSGFNVAAGATLALGRTTLGAAQNIGGAGNVSKNGSYFTDATIGGTNNTYTGTTTVSVSTLTLAAGGVINGTSSITVNNGNNSVFTNNGTITTPGALTVAGGNSATGGIFNNGNAGGTTPGVLTAASIALSSADGQTTGTAHGGAFTNNLNSAVTLTGNLTVGGEGSATAAITASAAGSIFTNAGGTVAIGGGITLNSGATTNTVSSKGGSYVQTSGTTTITGALALTSSAGVNVGAAGNDTALTLSGGSISAGSASLNGTTTISGGTLNITGNFYVGDTGQNRNGIINQSGGTVNLSSSTAGAIRFGHWSSGVLQNAYNLSGGVLNALNSSFNAGWDGNGSMTVSGSGVANLRTLAVSADGTANNATPNFTFSLGSAASGKTGGTLNVGTGGVTLSTATGVVSTIQLGDGTVGAFANWTSTAKMTLTDAATGTTFNTLDSVDGVTARTIGLSGILSGAGKLVKTGSGTLTLSGANTFAGGVTVNGGALATATSASALGSGAVTIGGGSLQAGAAGISGIASLTLNSGALNTTAGGVATTGAFALLGGTWTVGAAANTLTAGSFTLTGGVIDLSNILDANKTASGYSLISGTGTSSLTSANFTGGTAGYLYGIDANGDLVVTAVPEPSVYGLAGAGALAVALVRRRRKAA